MLVAMGVATSAAFIYSDSIPSVVAAPADTIFPDTQGYWGQAFIKSLAQQNVVTGYPDNTFKPEQPVDRDEFASILHNAFSQNTERQLSRGSVYKDVPVGYWAAPAIQDAYEMGFMKGYPTGEFRPNQPISKVEVLVSLARNLNLPKPNTAVDNSMSSTSASTPVINSEKPANRRRVAKRPLIFPLAMTVLMQPLMARPTEATPAETTSSTANELSQPSQSASTTGSQRPVSLILSDYYKDAEKIPHYAINDVARMTAAGIVVNYPDLRLLNPNQPATRGEVAAIIHRALVHQGKVAPIPASETASNYIVNR
ncbi:MAG: S-layer homology domain-containing protein [Snowella sp.]|nr:S-layer homology domain-containing protein [Snowella sp.]